MTASGYLKNDIVYIQDASLIEVGDVIVFYWAPDQYEAVDFDEKKHRFGFMKWSLLKTKTDLFLTLRKEAAMKRMTVCISRRALFWAKRYYCLLFSADFSICFNAARAFGFARDALLFVVGIVKLGTDCSFKRKRSRAS